MAAPLAEDGPAPDVGLELEPDAPTLAPIDPHIGARPHVGFVDAGRTGVTPCGGATLDPSDSRPHAFVDNGRTGTEPWAGGAGLGARGDQPSGSADEIRPVYEVVRDLTRVVRRSAWVPSGRVTEAEASVRPGTGSITVTRSWRGIDAGDQDSNGWYITQAAAARINEHEVKHVQKSLELYTDLVGPVLDPASAGMTTRQRKGDAALATAALRAAINWPAVLSAVRAFQAADKLANQPNGTVDTEDLDSGTWPHVVQTARDVDNIAYTHIGKMRTEALPGTPPGG